MKRLPKKIPKNKFITALISLIFAYLLWAVANTSGADPTTTRNYNSIAINYVGLADNLTIENKIDTVDIKLYGRTAQLNQVNKNNIIATVDLSQITAPGTYTFEVVITGLSDSVSISDISPKYLTLTLSELSTKQMNFNIDITGNLPSGYYVLDHSANTDTVVVSGPQQALSSVESVRGEINLSSNRYDFESLVNLYAFDSEGNVVEGVNISPNQIQVSTLVGMTKTVGINIVTSGSCPEGYELVSTSANISSIEISGPVSIVNNLTSVSTSPINLNSVTQSQTVQANLVLDGGVSASTDSISVYIEIRTGNATKEMTYTSLQVRNLPANLTCDLSAFSSLTISVTGSKEIIDSLSNSDIIAYINLSNLSAGTHTVDIQYSIPDGVTILTSSLNTVTVRLSE